MPITPQQIVALAEEAKQNGQLALAGILHGVTSSMYAGSEITLYDHVCVFARSQIAILEAMMRLDSAVGSTPSEN